MHPDQQRALDYLERKGTEQPVADLQQRVAETLEGLERLLTSLPEATVGRSPEPGTWSVAEVVDHLIESHSPAVEQLRRALRGQDPGPVIPAHLRSAALAPWRELLASLQQVHRDFLDALAEATEDTPLDTRIPIAMVLKIEGERVEWTAHLDWKAYAAGIRVHTLEHHQQVGRILAAV